MTIRVVRTSTIKGLERSITELNDRASSEKTRADVAEDRIERALSLLNRRDLPGGEAIRAILAGLDQAPAASGEPTGLVW
ncbi:hypothetical protein [Streptomyces chartreusis]|uniref:hypothetical protein n=1 Tax=Streptomyces chartreusis TaxID=1969 RepID=UPI00380E8223